MKKMMMLFVLLPLLAVGQRKFKGKQPLFTSSQCLNGDCDMGTGTAKNANGDLYYGSWRDGKPHGLGSVYFDLDNESYAPGTFFTGRFAFGLIDGMGTFDFPGRAQDDGKVSEVAGLCSF